jgi:hypothetical protein
MKPTLFVVGLVLTLAFCETARPQATTGNDIQNKCKQAIHDVENNSPSWSGGICLGFIDGATETHVMWEVFDAHVGKQYPNMDYCLPAGANKNPNPTGSS